MTGPGLPPPVDLTTRFGIVNVLPTTVVLGGITVLVMAGAPGAAPSLARLSASIDGAGPVGTAALAVAVFVVSLVSQPFELPLIRFLEGYWPAWSPLLRLAGLGTALHDRRRGRLRFIAAATDVDRRRARIRNAADVALGGYPREGAVLPTALGNRLRAMEERAGAPYGLDAITAWPRLYLVLPDRTRMHTDDLRNQLDAAVRLAFLAVAAAVATGLLLLRHPAWWWLPALAVLLGLLSYRAAVAAAVVYGDAVRAAFDMHHLLLLDGFGAERPTDTDAEVALHDRLMRLFDGEDENVIYRELPP